MHALLDLILRYKHWLVFLLLEVISLGFLLSYDGYQKSVYLTTAGEVTGVISDVIGSVVSYWNLQEENRSLEAENQRLHKQVNAMRRQLATSQRPIEKFRNPTDNYHIVQAQVVNMTLHRANNLMTINKGEADGIRPEMGVVCSRGVVGIVYMTSRHYSIVMPLLNIHSKISCRLRHSEHFGSCIWKRGYADMGFVTNVPRHAPVELGDTVETNGYSDIFPPGFPIGKVRSIGDSDDGMAFLLKIKLFANFPTLREVSVITNYQAPERRELEEQAEHPGEKEKEKEKESKNTTSPAPPQKENNDTVQ